MNFRSRSSFTLIELLVVIAILAVLATAVVLVLNPSQLLAQGRDSTRLSDLAALNSALSLFQADAYTQSLGTPNTLYISVPDNASSTCGSLGLPTPPTGYSYHCVPSASSTRIDGTGWIPVNLTLISSGSPLSKLPIDPINTTSSGLYYTYVSGGSYELTGLPESQKYKAQIEGNPMIPMIPGVIAYGSNLTLSPLFSTQGLVGYWPLDEGSGSTANDMSGNGNNGTWNGSGTHYAQGKVGGFAGQFNGTSTQDYTSAPYNTSLNVTSLTITAWVKNSATGERVVASKFGSSPYQGYWFGEDSGGGLRVCLGTGGQTCINKGLFPTDNTWHFISFTYDNTTGTWNFYIDASTTGSSTAVTAIAPVNTDFRIGVGQWSSSDYFQGLIDDVRIYNRALSAAEIAAIYNAQK